MNYETAMQKFESEIKLQAMDLKNYAAKEGSNDFIIDKRNNSIQTLTDIYNGLCIPQAKLLQEIGREMERLLKVDPNLSGFNIYIVKQDSGYPGLIKCSWI